MSESHTPENPYSQVEPWDLVSSGYADTTMKIFIGYAEKALAYAQVSPQDHIVDVACGPGTLSLLAAERVEQVDALDFSEQMLAQLHERVQQSGVRNIQLIQGDGQNLPYADASFDAAFSMFGLMFFPDRVAGMKELRRTLKAGGRAVISSWLPMQESEAMMAMFSVVQALNPEVPDPQANMTSLENPTVFEQELVQAGFSNIQIHKASLRYRYQNVEQLWDWLERGGAPLVVMKSQLSESEWQEKSQIALNHLHTRYGSGSVELEFLAWLAVAQK